MQLNDARDTRLKQRANDLKQQSSMVVLPDLMSLKLIINEYFSAKIMEFNQMISRTQNFVGIRHNVCQNCLNKYILMKQ